MFSGFTGQNLDQSKYSSRYLTVKRGQNYHGIFRMNEIRYCLTFFYTQNCFWASSFAKETLHIAKGPRELPHFGGREFNYMGANCCSMCMRSMAPKRNQHFETMYYRQKSIKAEKTTLRDACPSFPTLQEVLRFPRVLGKLSEIRKCYVP